MRILLIMLVLVVGCSSKPVQTNIGGEAVSAKEMELDGYNSRLHNLLTIPDTMAMDYEPVIPPNFNLKDIISFKELAEGGQNTNIKLANGKEVHFIDSVSLDREDGGLTTWNFRGYDNINKVVYMMKKESYDFFKLFGVSLTTGNQFTVYDGNPGSENEWMYGWSFSPDMKYLIKAGDLDNGEYGWSLVNLTNGIETKKLYDHYIEFIAEPWWKREGEFRIAYSRIPYVYGLEYLDDYKFYLLIKQKLPIRWFMLSTYEFITKEQIYNIKCEQISEKVLDTKKIEIQ